MGMDFDKLPPAGIESKRFEEVTIGDLFVWVDEVESESVAMRMDADRYVYLNSGYEQLCPPEDTHRPVYMVRGTLGWNFISE